MIDAISVDLTGFLDAICLYSYFAGFTYREHPYNFYYMVIFPFTQALIQIYAPAFLKIDNLRERLCYTLNRSLLIYEASIYGSL